MKKLLIKISLLVCFAINGAVIAAEYSPNFKGTDINEFIDIVGKSLKKTFIIDPNVRGKINVRSYDLLNEDQYYQFFLNVLQVYGYAVVEMPNGVYKVVKDKDAKTMANPVVENSLVDGDEFITRVIPVYNVSVRELSPLLRQLIDQGSGGNVTSYDPSNVMMLTGRAAVVNRLVDIIKRVDKAGDQDIDIVKLEFASAGELVRILETIIKKDAKSTPSFLEPKIVADDRTNSIIVSGDIQARQRIVTLVKRLDSDLETNGNTRVIYLKYAKAKDVVAVLKGVSASISADGTKTTSTNRRNSNRDISIEAHEESNSLVITAEPDMLRSLEDVIRQLDIRRAQVQVEAIIVEVSEGSGINLGIQLVHEDVGLIQFNDGNNVSIVEIGAAYSAGQGQDGTSTTVVSADGSTTTSTTADEPDDYTALGSLLAGINGFWGGIIEEDWAAVIQAVSSDTNSNILATPYITTLDNQEATFTVGQEVPILTGQTASANNTNPFQTIDRKEVGIKLKVTPQINEGNTVQLKIEQEVSSVSGATSVDISINKRALTTTVLAEDGSTVVLGGLIDEDVQESVSKIPLLGDLPVLGKLFSSTSTSKRKTNMLVFIRPTIIKDDATLNRISHRKYNYIRAQQLKAEQDGVSLMPSERQPTLPEWEDENSLPQSVEEYLLRKDQEEN